MPQWVKNVAAAPGVMRWHDEVVTITDPRPIDAALADRRYPAISRFLFWLDGTREFVRLSRASTAAEGR